MVLLHVVYRMLTFLCQRWESLSHAWDSYSRGKVVRLSGGSGYLGSVSAIAVKATGTGLTLSKKCFLKTILHLHLGG